MSIETRPWAVLKFGGTSVASARHWRRIGEILENRIEGGERPLVVCSAVAGISDTLENLLSAKARGLETPPILEELRDRHLQLGRDLGLDVAPLVLSCLSGLEVLLAEAEGFDETPPSLRARVLAMGELLSTRIAARWLEKRGFSTAWVDARDLLHALPPLPGSSPLQRYCEAKCAFDCDARASSRLESIEADVVITQGFIARGEDDGTVLLGRGGSDTAASYLAAILGARRLEIWTDVAGIFSANPRTVARARALPHLSYDEAESLAGLGACVLHPRAVHPVRVAGVPLHIRWTEQPDAAGTIVGEHPASTGVKAVVRRDHLCLITLHKPAGWKPVGFLADVTACFKRSALPVDLVSSSPSRIRVTLDLSNAGAEESLPKLIDDLRSVAEPEVQKDVASVSLVGHRIQGALNGLGPVLASMQRQRLLMLTHCASDLSLTLVVPRRDAGVVVRKLHARLFEQGSAVEAKRPATAEV